MQGKIPGPFVGYDGEYLAQRSMLSDKTKQGSQCNELPKQLYRIKE